MAKKITLAQATVRNSNILKIDHRFKEIADLLQAELLQFTSVESINSILEPVYASFLKSGIITADGSINRQEVFSVDARLPHQIAGDTVLSGSFYSIDYNSESEYGLISWNGHICFHEFQVANEKFINIAKQYSVRKMIRDTRNFTILSPKSRQWFTEYLIPQFCAAGITYSAVITPENPLSRKIVEDIIRETASDKIDVRLFSRVEEATAWIKNI